MVFDFDFKMKMLLMILILKWNHNYNDFTQQWKYVMIVIHQLCRWNFTLGSIMRCLTLRLQNPNNYCTCWFRFILTDVILLLIVRVSWKMLLLTMKLRYSKIIASRTNLHFTGYWKITKKMIWIKSKII